MRLTPVLRQFDRKDVVGFIGLGAMGSHMFNNLVVRSQKKSPQKLPRFVVFDVNQKGMSALIGINSIRNPSIKIIVAESPQQVAAEASTIISMVPTSKNVRDVYLGDKGVLSAFQNLSREQIEDTLCLDESTIEQAESQSIASEIRAAGAEMLDAPVSGGVVGAEKGTLTIMVGGSKAGFIKAEPILELMSKKVIHCGNLGAGLAAKISNNLLLGISMLGVSEAMLLGKRLGLQPQILADIINSSTGQCWSSTVNNTVPEVTVEGQSPPAKRDYQGGFVTKLAHKDLVLAVAAAKSVGLPLELGVLTEKIYRPQAQPGSKWSNRDFSSIYAAIGD